MGWWRGRLGGAIVIASMLVMASGCGGGGSDSRSGSTVSDVSDISGAALQKSDAPSGYTQRFSQVFSSYQATMSVGKPATTCGAPKATTKTNWKQGLAAELLKGSGFTIHAMAECAWLLKSDLDAHTAYVQEVAESKATKGAKVLSVPKVGDEQTASSATVSGITAYVVVFRHHNALVRMAYAAVGKADMSLRDFGTVAVNINSRLK